MPNAQSSTARHANAINSTIAYVRLAIELAITCRITVGFCSAPLQPSNRTSRVLGVARRERVSVLPNASDPPVRRECAVTITETLRDSPDLQRKLHFVRRVSRE